MKKEQSGKRVGLIALGVLFGAIAVAAILPKQNSTPDLPGIGQMVQGSDRAIIAQKVETQNGIQVDNQFAQPITGEIVVVRMVVTNTGSASGNMMFSQFELRDSQGRTYDELTDMTYSLWRDKQGVKPRSEDMFPGEARPDLAAFRVSPGATGFTLIWNGKEVSLD